jgi:hypothetical protein
VPHTVEKLLTWVTALFQTSPQSKLCTQSYGPPKLRESQFWEFLDSHLGVPRQNDIWVLVQWPSTLRGKVVASPKFGPWWVLRVLWVRVCPWFIRAQKCSNYAVTNVLFSLCRSVWVIDLLVNLPNPIPKLQHALLPSKCCEPRSVPQLPIPLSSPLDSQLSSLCKGTFQSILVGWSLLTWWCKCKGGLK